MGLINFIKKNFIADYDLEQVDNDIDAEFSPNEQEKMSTLISELNKNIERHGNDEKRKKERGTNEKSKISNYDKTKEEKRKVEEEEARYDQLLNSVQAQTLLKAVDQMNNKTEDKKIEEPKNSEESQKLLGLQLWEKNQKLEKELGLIEGQELFEDQDLFEDQERLEESSEYQEQAVNISDVSKESKSLEQVNTDIYDASDIKSYVTTQCELMEEASGYIELAMEEYDEVTQQFSDIQMLENAPVKMKSDIMEAAVRIDNLTVDRRIVKSSEHRISSRTYNRLEQFSDEIPRGIEYMKKQENYYENVKRDMRILEGERLGLRMEARSLTKRQLKIKSVSVVAIACLALVFIVFLFAMNTADYDEQNMEMFILVIFLGAVLALGMFAYLRHTQRQVLVTEVKLNKAINLLNKMKIKYINAANTLDYEYGKFHVKSSYELEKKYDVYREMKDEQRKLAKMTSSLNEAEEELQKLLTKLGLYTPHLWSGQAKALFNPKEMDTVKRRLSSQRQKLKNQLDYNEMRIEEAKRNIKNVTTRYPQYANATISVIEHYENKTRDGAKTEN